MITRLTTGVALAAGLCCATSAAHAQRADVNFAFGGATTNSANATDTFAALAASQGDPSVQQALAGIRAQGLDVIGVAQQLDFAEATLNDVSESDVFWVYAGTNNYIAGLLAPTAPVDQDYLVSLATNTVTELTTALYRLHAMGATRFVVPNLPALGDLPLFASIPGLDQAATGATAIHNGALEQAVAQFATTTGAEVHYIDVFDVFLGHKYGQDSIFTDTSAACNEVVPPEQLAEPGICDGYLFLDNVHPASAAWAPVAALAADALAGNDVDRIVTIGDSFSDLGMLSDTFLRMLGQPFPAPPFTEGRFTEDKNVVQQLEDLLATPVNTTFFAQPFIYDAPLTESTTLQTVVFEQGVPQQVDVAGDMFLPKAVSGIGEAGSEVEITFADAGAHGWDLKCTYNEAGDGQFAFDECKKVGEGLISKFLVHIGLDPLLFPSHEEGGDRLTASSVTVTIDEDIEEVVLDLLHY